MSQAHAQQITVAAQAKVHECCIAGVVDVLVMNDDGIDLLRVTLEHVHRTELAAQRTSGTEPSVFDGSVGPFVSLLLIAPSSLEARQLDRPTALESGEDPGIRELQSAEVVRQLVEVHVPRRLHVLANLTHGCLHRRITRR